MIKKARLDDVVEFVQGINPTRVKEMEIAFYDQADFNRDREYSWEGSVNDSARQDKDRILSIDDIVISNSADIATRVRQSSVGKTLSLNFLKVNFKDGQLDKNYFLYVFNAFKDVQRQKDRERIGMTIQRIPVNSLREIVIPLPELEEQRKIGQIYIASLDLQAKLAQKARLIDQFTGAALDNNMKEVMK